jgi:hypothetical protein
MERRNLQSLIRASWYQRRATIPQPPRCERGALPVELRWCGRIGRIRTSIACVSDRYTQPLCYDPLRRFRHRGQKGHGDVLTLDILSVLCGSALVGPKGFEPLSACYKQAALTVELQASGWWAGRDSHPHSNAALLQSAGLTRAQADPNGWCCHRASNPDHLLGRQARSSVTQ